MDGSPSPISDPDSMDGLHDAEAVSVADEPLVFLSRSHPRRTPLAVAYGSALVRPLAVCNLPVMILCLVAALEGQSLLPFLYVGFPGAFVVAMAWTWFSLRLRLDEVHVAPGRGAAVRTRWDVLHRHPLPPFSPVVLLKANSEAVIAAIGLDTFVFARAEWPDPERLVEALRSVKMPFPTRLHDFDPE